MSVASVTSNLHEPTDPTPRSVVPWRITDAFVVCATMVGLPLVLNELLPEYIKRKAAVSTGVQVGMNIMLIAAVVLIARFRGANLRQLWLGRSNWLWEFLVGLALAVPLIVAVALVNIAVRYVLGPAATVQRSAAIIGHMPFNARLVMSLAGISLVPIAEELIFRGLLLESLRARIGLWVAWLTQGVVFALVHRDAPQFAGGLFVAGLGYGAIYLWRRSLLSALALHAGFNIVPMAWLLALAWINHHSHATTWQEAEQPPIWWSSPSLDTWVQKIPVHDTAEQQYKGAMVFGRRGLQLWKMEARAFAKVIELFPDDTRYGAKSLGGIQDIYLFALRDSRRAIITGRKLLEDYPGVRHECAHALLNNAAAYLRLGEYDMASQLAQEVLEKYPDLPRAQQGARTLLDELEWRRSQ